MAQFVSHYTLMGVHFTVTVDHDIRDTHLDAVRSRFASLQPMFAQISASSKQELGEWRDVTEPGSSRPDHFHTPAGFSVLIGSAALTFHHGTRFSTFINDVAKRDSMRRFSRHVARIFAQDRVLYAPCEGIGDVIADWRMEGLSLADMEARLRKRSRPPATISELARRSLPELRYYIDEFEDFKVDTAG
jgi:hypothetical protein